MNLVADKKGGSTMFEIVIVLSLVTFILLYPLAVFTLAYKQNLLADTMVTGLQIVAIEGGLTDKAEDLIYRNLEAKRLLPAGSNEEQRGQVIIACNADARNGNVQNLVARDSSSPKIMLEIWYPANKEVQFIQGVCRLIGISQTSLPQFKTPEGKTGKYYYEAGYIFSEYVE